MKFSIYYLFIIIACVKIVSSEEINDTIATNDSLKLKKTIALDSIKGVPDSTQDSAATVNTLQQVVDSGAVAADSSTLSPTAKTKPVQSDSGSTPDLPAIDTTYRVWNFPYWSFGIGWSLGSMPVFDDWRDGLPNTLDKIPELVDTLDSVNLSPPTVNNNPGTYNVNFPLSIAYNRVIDEDNSISYKAVFSWMRKSFEAFVQTDSGVTFWATERTLSIMSLSIGLFYNHTIAAKLFSIANSEKARITLGFSGTPLIHLKHRIDTYNGPDTDYSAYGIGFTWYAGITTLRKLSQNNGLEVGVLYNGLWHGRFMHDGHHTASYDINRQNALSSEILEFTAHRFLLCFSILAGKKEYREKPL